MSEYRQIEDPIQGFDVKVDFGFPGAGVSAVEFFTDGETRSCRVTYGVSTSNFKYVLAKKPPTKVVITVSDYMNGVCNELNFVVTGKPSIRTSIAAGRLVVRGELTLSDASIIEAENEKANKTLAEVCMDLENTSPPFAAFVQSALQHVNNPFGTVITE
jgi:hypothetical protein